MKHSLQLFWNDSNLTPEKQKSFWKKKSSPFIEALLSKISFLYLVYCMHGIQESLWQGNWYIIDTEVIWRNFMKANKLLKTLTIKLSKTFMLNTSLSLCCSIWWKENSQRWSSITKISLKSNFTAIEKFAKSCENAFDKNTFYIQFSFPYSFKSNLNILLHLFLKSKQSRSE